MVVRFVSVSPSGSVEQHPDPVRLALDTDVPIAPIVVLLPGRRVSHFSQGNVASEVETTLELGCVGSDQLQTDLVVGRLITISELHQEFRGFAGESLRRTSGESCCHPDASESECPAS